MSQLVARCVRAFGAEGGPTIRYQAGAGGGEWRTFSALAALAAPEGDIVADAADLAAVWAAFFSLVEQRVGIAITLATNQGIAIAYVVIEERAERRCFYHGVYVRSPNLPAGVMVFDPTVLAEADAARAKGAIPGIYGSGVTEIAWLDAGCEA